MPWRGLPCVRGRAAAIVASRDGIHAPRFGRRGVGGSLLALSGEWILFHSFMGSHLLARVLSLSLIGFAHVALHLCAIPLLRRFLPRPYRDRIEHLEPFMQVKLSRMLRSGVYNLCACFCGAVLLWRCHSLWDLCHVYTPLHDVAFQVAVVHWLVSFAEDYAATSRSFVVRFAKPESELSVQGLRLGEEDGPQGFLYVGCLVHHLVAAAAYVFLLHTRLLGGMGAIGLLYEGPVVLMTAREVLIDFEPAMGWRRALGGDRALRCVAIATHLVFVPCRFGGDCVYLYALWRHLSAQWAGADVRSDGGIGSLPPYAQTACHLFAWSFMPLNACGWPCLIWQSLEDLGMASILGGGGGGGSDTKPNGHGRLKEVDNEAAPLRPAEEMETAPIVSQFDKAKEHATLLTTPPPPEDWRLPMRTVYPWWWFPGTFVVVELGCLLGPRRTSLMALVTDGTYGVMEHSALMRVHVWAAMVMWLLGAVQALGKGLRRSRPKLHRALGVVFLLDWALIVGPTALYLSLYIQGDSMFGTLSAMVLCDVTLLSYYFFWRAWRVARERVRGAKSLQLHGNLMGMGMLGTMSQLPQRLFMLIILFIRKSISESLLYFHCDRAAAGLRYWVTDQFAFGLSMVLGGAIVLFAVDGPRTEYMNKGCLPREKYPLREGMFGETVEDELEMYPYDVTKPSVRWKWRTRLFVYFVARGVVTSFWSEQPTLAF